MDKLRYPTLLISTILPIFTSQADVIILMDYDDGDAGNGVHQANIADGGVTASSWDGLGTGLQYNTNLNSGIGSNNNLVLGANRLAARAVDPSYKIALGDTFEMSYMWRAASNWDAPDRITFSLYYTDTDAIDGIRQPLFTYVAATAATTVYGLETVPTHEVTDAGAVGKSLYILLADNASAVAGEFARVDNVFVQVTQAVPEPSALILLGFGGCLLIFRGRLG